MKTFEEYSTITNWQKVKNLLLSKIDPEIINRLNTISKSIKGNEELNITIILKYNKRKIPKDFTSDYLIIDDQGDPGHRLSPMVYCGTIKITNNNYEFLLGNNLSEKESIVYAESIKNTLGQITDVLKLNPEVIYFTQKYNLNKNTNQLLSYLFDNIAKETKIRQFPEQSFICYIQK